MRSEFVRIERRLARLSECLQKLELLRRRTLEEFLADSYLHGIAARNLEVASQCCIDISNRIIRFVSLVANIRSYNVNRPPNLDCADVPQCNFRVLSPGPHHFDRDYDGIGCES